MSGLRPDQQLELVAEAIQKSAEARKEYVRALARSAPDLDTYVEKLRKTSEAEWEIIRMLGVDLEKARVLRWGPSAAGGSATSH